MEQVQKVYVGSSSNRGIAEYIFQNGELVQGKWTKDERRCTYLAKTDSHLYGVIEIERDDLQEGGYIVSYQIEKEGLKKVEKKPSNGKGPCHIAVDQEKKVMSICHYIDGTFCVRKLLQDGTIGEIFDLQKIENGKLHCSQFGKEDLFQIDLSNSRMRVYSISEKQLEKKAEYPFAQGIEPRHMILNQDQIYVITEKTCQLYEIRFQDGKFFLQNQYDLLSRKEQKEEKNTGCALKMSHDQENLYTTVRGKNEIQVFRRKDGETWKMIQTIPSGGNLPWDIAIDPKDQFVLVANLDSSRITVFSREAENGKLTYFSEEKVDSPTCILF